MAAFWLFMAALTRKTSNNQRDINAKVPNMVSSTTPKPIIMKKVYASVSSCLRVCVC